jgi:hypothetical protein
MPPPGWYDDPEQQWTWRWWDGTRWSHHRAPMWVAPQRDPRSFSAFFDDAVVGVKLAVRSVGMLLLPVWLALGALGWLATIAVFGSEGGRELRDLLRRGSFDGSSGELTDQEVDRAWELTRQLAIDAIPWLVVVGVAYLIVAAWSVALVAGARDRAAGRALRRVPIVVASWLVMASVYVLVWTATALPVAVVVLADGGGVAIVLTAVFGVLLASVVSCWLWGRLALASVIAATGGPGIGVQRSWELTQDRFWYVFGRLIVVGLIAGVASGVANSVSGFGQFFDLAVYVALVCVLQSVAAVAATMVTVRGHVAIVGQLDATGSSPATGDA